MTDRLSFENREGVAMIRLDDGKANAMQGAFFAQLGTALDQAESDRAGAVVILGRDGFFSGGLDLKSLPLLPREELIGVMRAFSDTLRRVFLFPAPVLCAASGHALAGGMVLYLAGDVRLAAAEDRFRFGLNEVAIGMPLPRWVACLCAHSVPTAVQGQVLLQAELMSPAATLARGITHALAPAAELADAAWARARELARLDTRAYAKSKLRLRGPVAEAFGTWTEEEWADLFTLGPFARPD